MQIIVIRRALDSLIVEAKDFHAWKTDSLFKYTGIWGSPDQ